MKKKGFEEVAPGVMVNTKRFKIKFPHPGPCWIIRNTEDTVSLASDNGISVFSTEEKAQTHIDEIALKGAVLKCYTWDELVDKFGQQYGSVVVNPKTKPGFCSVVPLKKDI